MSQRLLDYLDATKRGGFGWIPKYEDALTQSRQSDAWMCGWYSGLLDEAIRAVGVDRLRRVVAGQMDIEAQAEKPPEAE